MLLTHLGFPYMFIIWIMNFISDVPYSVLLNGSPSPFFTAERGLRQACPLSPLLFLLIMEGLSRLIGAEHRRGRITRIKIMENCSLTHLLFVDDVLIFLNGSMADTCALQNVFDLFQKASGMTINVEKRLNVWYNRYLTRAGRLTLIKAVLEATPVYWMSLAWIPRGILARLQKICCRFLWKGNKQGNLFAWVKWETIARPKKWGGWGIKRLDLFAKALAAKLGWQLITSHSL
eukprot:PITA_21333